MIELRRVDGAAQKSLLRDLQLATLPYDKAVDTASGHWWIAYEDRTPIAFGGYVPSSQWADTVYLCRSGVLETHRGMGLQKRLIRVRERHARQNGMAWAITDTNQNPASANSLIACGYRLYLPAIPWGYRTASYWRKKLRTS